MERLNGRGLIAGIVAWCTMVAVFVNNSTCVQHKNCDTDDVLLIGIGLAGLLFPSYFIALTVSGMTAKKSRDGEWASEQIREVSPRFSLGRHIKIWGFYYYIAIIVLIFGYELLYPYL